MTILHTDQKIVKDIPIEQETWCGYKPMMRPWFCVGGCRAAYHEDRRLGLNYGGVLMPFDSGNERIVGHHDACRWTHRCPYCGADKPEKRKENVNVDTTADHSPAF